MTVSRRRALAGIAALVALPLLAACPGQSEQEPVEDCDVDDLAEGDEDCYGKAPKSKSKKKTPKK